MAESLSEILGRLRFEGGPVEKQSACTCVRMPRRNSSGTSGKRRNLPFPATWLSWCLS
jgi:hypothetical protein